MSRVDYTTYELITEDITDDPQMPRWRVRVLVGRDEFADVKVYGPLEVAMQMVQPAMVTAARGTAAVLADLTGAGA